MTDESRQQRRIAVVAAQLAALGPLALMQAAQRILMLEDQLRIHERSPTPPAPCRPLRVTRKDIPSR